MDAGRRSRAARLAASVFAAALGSLGPAVSSAAGSATATRPYEVVVGAGQSQVVEIPLVYRDLLIADPKIADVLPLNTHSVYVVGKGIGSTTLTVYGPGKQLITAFNVVVGPDAQGLKARLMEVLPDEKDIAVHIANQSIVMSGTVTSPATLHQAIALANSYAPDKVVNMLGVEGTQQVMLSVRFLEMERSTAKDLRLNVNRSRSGDNPQVRVFTGDTNNSNLNILPTSFGFLSTLYNKNLDVLFDALETKGRIRTLAEPSLVAMSGDTASFLAGGEFPIPVQQNGGSSTQNGVTSTTAASITVEYKPFGVALAFTPTILKDGLINIVVSPEVSEIDPTISIDLSLIKIPGIKVRRARTTVELRDGESFTIAGLLKEDYQSQIRQFPFAGDVPVLGALFRSNGYKREETELVVVVTPHLVTPRRGPIAMPGDHFVPPSDFELFLFGSLQGSNLGLKPEQKALMTVDPTKGGVDGPHGHVLF